ncbi:G-protein coupled receptor Mth-like [Nilaparvata lugens]|uniref:G-protein coupled receptor Mth-like n=1 Tax=Nilaparvata lugens TaxID=108931 RepID=UPI00193DDA35|nr:G-protein coupled receptor Mth-like [Nilaparvata lugens]
MRTNKAMYVYFYGPLLSLNALNAVFFVQTLRTIVRVKKDNNNVFNKSECSRRHHQADMKWLSVFAKLYVLMGITWILDIVAFELSDPQHRDETIFKVIEYSIDIFNICQGILIFFITMVTKETARTLSKTFSETIMRARGSLTNSKKQYAPDPSTIRDDACSSKERMPRHAVYVRWKPAAIKLILIKKTIQEFVKKPTLPK